ncbi:MAG: DUF5069 domain-containing protein [Verrucomicrobiota bacterium]
MKKVPVSPYQKLADLYYVPRMLNKIRLHDEELLREDLCNNLGEGFDAFCCHYLGVAYGDVKQQVAQGLSDDEILDWCLKTGLKRELNELDTKIWNLFISKVGWNDHVSEILECRKKESGFEDRDDIITMFQYLDADEGR